MTELEKSRFANWLLEHPDASLPEAIQKAGGAATPMEIIASFLASGAITDKGREHLKQVFCQAFDDVLWSQGLIDCLCMIVELYRDKAKRAPGAPTAEKPAAGEVQGAQADKFLSPIIGMFWDGNGRMVLGLPFSQDGSRFCLQLAPDLFAEFTQDRIYGCGYFADAFDIIGKATGFAALTGVSPTAKHPVLYPANAPVSRASAEAALFSALFSDLRLAPEAPAPARKEPLAAPDMDQGGVCPPRSQEGPAR
ncbi:hypothetical protein [Desulfovibrio piger]|uniref:hypothetical protein n=1 Tax=Desulfovibrio piger TaxID=901 RepID=UPI0026ECD2D6|nr:hypothetical protein [Desulfovibrio piger]